MSETRKLHLPKSFDIYNFQYKKPIHNDLAVCIMYFNANKSKRILMNCLYVIEKLKMANIPVFVMEMYTTFPEIKDAFHLKADILLFQKERMCHLIEERIPKSYTKLMFMDGDIVFDNLNWYNDMSTKLNHFNAVHGFTKFVRLDITYKHIIDECLSFTFRKKYGDKVHRLEDPRLDSTLGALGAFSVTGSTKLAYFKMMLLEHLIHIVYSRGALYQIHIHIQSSYRKV